MNLNKCLLTLLIVFLSLSTFSQTWEDDSLVIRQILDTNGLYSVPVDSVIGKKDSTGRVVTMGFGKPSFYILPASIKNLDELFSFGIDGTNIEAIPPEIGELKKLKMLTIMRNRKLTILPPEIGDLESLQRLNISCNEITAIPPEIGKLKKLYSFSFGENKITHIPDEFCDLVSLAKPVACNNMISYIPENIGNMPAFHSINLDYNKLKHVPNSLIPFGLDDVRMCFNDSLVFTEEQKAAWGVTDYDDYFWKHCPVEVEEEVVQKQPKNSQVQINSQAIFLRVNNSGHSSCSVYNLSGQRIETLVNGVLSVGTHSISWNRAYYTPGIYFVRYSAMDGHSFIKKVVVK